MVAGPGFGGDLDDGQVEHQVCEGRPGDAADDLGGAVGAHLGQRETGACAAAEIPVRE